MDREEDGDPQQPGGQWQATIGGRAGGAVPLETVPRTVYTGSVPSPIFCMFLKRLRRLGSNVSRRPDEEEEADAPVGAASPSSHASEPIS